jgi:hypothetical protein
LLIVRPDQIISYTIKKKEEELNYGEDRFEYTNQKSVKMHLNRVNEDRGCWNEKGMPMQKSGAYFFKDCMIIPTKFGIH